MKIKAKDLKPGDVFIYKGNQQVAIDNFMGNTLSVTNERLYLDKEKRKKYTYGYTNATIIYIEAEDEVEVLRNIEK